MVVVVVVEVIAVLVRGLAGIRCTLRWGNKRKHNEGAICKGGAPDLVPPAPGALEPGWGFLAGAVALESSHCSLEAQQGGSLGNEYFQPLSPIFCWCLPVAKTNHT